MINTLCHMIFHCQTHLASSMSMPFNPGMFHDGFCSKACHGFGWPQTWALHKYICVGSSSIGWFDDKHTLPHDCSLPHTSSKYYGHAIPPLVFHVGFCPKACHAFGRPQTWALNIHICVGTSLIGWFDDKHTLPHDCLLPDKSSN